MLCTGWAREGGRKKGGEGAAREGEHCSAYSPPLVLKQQQEEREKESEGEGGREPQVKKQRGKQQSASAAKGEKKNGALKSPLPSSILCLSSFFLPSCSGSASVSLSLPAFWLFCGILTMPGECYPAFHMSLAVLCVLFAWVHAVREISFFFSFCANVWPQIEMWTCACRGCFIETVYAPLPLCAVRTPDVLCSSLSVTMQGRLLSTAHTHMLYYILRKFRILSQDYIIAFRSLRVFHSENSFITSNNLYSRDDNAEMDFFNCEQWLHPKCSNISQSWPVWRRAAS